jgi:hypothetical protein
MLSITSTAAASFLPAMPAHSVLPATPGLARLSSIRMLAEDQSFGVDARRVGDYGFDPLGLGTDETFVPFREAEIKHGRLAMLAAVAWPLQEIFHPIIVDALRGAGIEVKDALIDSGGASPSLLNGGLGQLEIAPALSLAVFLASVLELQDLRAREARGLKFNEYQKDRTPGDLAFDPLNIIGSMRPEEQVGFMEKELLNGRLGMIAVTCYVAEEFGFGTPVIQFTPDLFQPIIFAADFRAFMDGAFGMASMDGAINGIAY